MPVMEDTMNTRFDDLTTMLIDAHQAELRAEAARRRLVARTNGDRQGNDALRRPRRTVAGLFIAALTRPVQGTHPWGRAMPHRDGA